MKVILTTQFSPWSAYSGGGQRSTHNLALAMTRRGLDVTVVFVKPPWEKVDVPVDLPYGIEWATLVARQSASGAVLRPLVPVSVAQVVARLVKKSADPVVVHSNGEESALLPLLRRRLKFGLVVTPRFPRFPEALGKTSLSIAEKAKLWLKDTRYVQLKAAARGADFCSPPSHYSGRLCADAFDLPLDKVAPVHNGVPHEFLDYHWKPSKEARPLLFFGRFAEDKGIDTLVDALQLLGPKAPPCLLVGRGPLQNRVDEMAAKSNGKIQVRGWADHHALGQLLTESMMAVIPSREENFSLAVLSVMAVGTPLITTRVGGTAEVVEHEKNALLIEADDPQSLSQCIARICTNPREAAKFGKQASAIVRSDFTWDVAAEKFNRLYEQALTE